MSASTDAIQKITVPLFVPDLGEPEKQGLAAVIDSKWVAMGAVCEKFEARFAAELGVKHAVSVNNCTAALHLAYMLCDIGPGDEVIVPSLTFAATANAVAYTGAKPVFADIAGMDDWTIDPAAIEAAITPRTKAIAVMHYGGYPCDMKGIMAIADNAGIPVVEDACHGLGGDIDGKAMGTLGRSGCFSFYSNKVITTGEGGMIVTNDDAVAARGRRLRSHGMTALAYDRMRGAMGYDIAELGYNYRLDDIRGAVGLAQMDRLAGSITRRRHLVEVYRRGLAAVSGVSFPRHGGRGNPAHYILPVLLDEKLDRVAVRQIMLEYGVQTSVHYPASHSFSHYGGRTGVLPYTEAVSNRVLTLPLYPSLTDEQVGLVCSALAEAIRHQ
jgi:dTDP-4-amino-4,6-dideoxygalactose transaminase